MIGRALSVFLVLAIAAGFAGCARQLDTGREAGEATIFRPIGKMQAKARAEEFLRAYVPEGRKNFPLQRITRNTDSPQGAYWIAHYSGKDIHTGIFVEIEERGGRGRVRGFLGNVLLSDNTTVNPGGATNEFRTLEDFRKQLARQQARFPRAR
jgi:hypothetical protein